MRTEADKMLESTTSAIGNAPASLMTDLGSTGFARHAWFRRQEGANGLSCQAIYIQGPNLLGITSKTGCVPVISEQVQPWLSRLSRNSFAVRSSSKLKLLLLSNNPVAICFSLSVRLLIV